MDLYKIKKAKDFPPHSKETLCKIYNEKGEQKYCTFPFRLIAVSSDSIKPCTWLRYYRELFENKDFDVYERWYSQDFDNVRRSIVEGKYHFCDMDNCPEYNNGKQEYFLTLQELEEKYPKIAEFVKNPVKYNKGPITANLSYDTRCNLSCPSCNRHLLPKFTKDKTKDISNKIISLGKDLEFIYLAGMGDPFGTKHYLEFLKTIDVQKDFPSLDTILLNTNAINFNKKNWESIPENTRKTITYVIVSMDGLYGIFEKNRYPAKWNTFEEQLKFIALLRKNNEIKHLRIYYVYQENNFRQMLDAVRFCEDIGVNSLFFARIRDWGTIKDESVMDQIDVNRENNPYNKEFKEIAEKIKNYKSNILEEIILME